MPPVLMVIGSIILLVGNIWLLINAFRVSILWGLGCLFLPFVSLIFLIMHWDRGGRPFLVSIAGGVLVFAGVLLATPEVPDDIEPEVVEDSAY